MQGACSFQRGCRCREDAAVGSVGAHRAHALYVTESILPCLLRKYLADRCTGESHEICAAVAFFRQWQFCQGSGNDGHVCDAQRAGR
jgi:hypothetical protein